MVEHSLPAIQSPTNPRGTRRCTHTLAALSHEKTDWPRYTVRFWINLPYCSARTALHVETVRQILTDAETWRGIVSGSGALDDQHHWMKSFQEVEHCWGGSARPAGALLGRFSTTCWSTAGEVQHELLEHCWDEIISGRNKLLDGFLNSSSTP